MLKERKEKRKGHGGLTLALERQRQAALEGSKASQTSMLVQCQAGERHGLKKQSRQHLSTTPKLVSELHTDTQRHTHMHP